MKAQIEQLSTEEGNEKTSAHVPHFKKGFSFPNEENGEGEQKDKDVFNSVCTVPSTSYRQSTFVEAY